jgi:glyoxylate utilization-related uncharacterized protein
VGEGVVHEGGRTEAIYVLIDGEVTVKGDGQTWTLTAKDVIFLKPGDSFSLSQVGDQPATLVHCWALG